jgi:hypothetical protein
LEKRIGEIMAWKLWLDDQWYDPNAVDKHPPIGWVGCESVERAMWLIRKMGLPVEMSLDHDLGCDEFGFEVLNGRDFVTILFDRYPDGPIPKWSVHSKNVGGGADNIRSFLASWEKSIDTCSFCKKEAFVESVGKDQNGDLDAPEICKNCKNLMSGEDE